MDHHKEISKVVQQMLHIYEIDSKCAISSKPHPRAPQFYLLSRSIRPFSLHQGGPLSMAMVVVQNVSLSRRQVLDSIPQIPPVTILTTLDGQSFYITIPYNEGIMSVLHLLREKRPPESRQSAHQH